MFVKTARGSRIMSCMFVGYVSTCSECRHNGVRVLLGTSVTLSPKFWRGDALKTWILPTILEGVKGRCLCLSPDCTTLASIAFV